MTTMLSFGDAMPGYDPDFFGPALGEGAGAAIAAAAAGATQAVDYAYKCGQGSSIYRCYGIGKVSHAILVDLQHQVNRFVGSKALTEDGIIGPATLQAIRSTLPQVAQLVTGQQIIATGTSTAVMTGSIQAGLDAVAKAAQELVRGYTVAADKKRGPESVLEKANQLISSIKTAGAATEAEVAVDKAKGLLPASFSQDQVKASGDALNRIGQALGPATAAAAAAADQLPTDSVKKSTMVYVAVGVGLTVAAVAAIGVIAMTSRPKRRRA